MGPRIPHHAGRSRVKSVQPNQSLQPTVLPPLRYGKPAAELGRYEHKGASLKLAMVTVLFAALQGCTVAYYKTDDNLNKSAKSVMPANCEITYSLEINAEQRQLTTGVTEKDEWVVKAQPQYVASTNKVFKQHGCIAKFEADSDKSDFVAKITISPYRSALGQEWLTGLSFGLIPSWGIRSSEYTYKFTNRVNSGHHSYSIDNVSFNHLILFPFFWVTFFTLDEQRAYENALSNFIENS